MTSPSSTSIADAGPPATPAAKARWRWLAAWTVCAVAAAWGLLRPDGMHPEDPDLLLLRDSADSGASWGTEVRRWFRLMHLSLQPAYAWVLLAPYLFWLTGRFHLGSGRWRSSLLVLGAAAVVWVLATSAYRQALAAARPDVVVFGVVESRETGAPSSAPGDLHPAERRVRGRMAGSASDPEALPERLSRAWARERFGEGTGMGALLQSNRAGLRRPAKLLMESEVRMVIGTNDASGEGARAVSNLASRLKIQVDHPPVWTRFPGVFGQARLASVLLDLFACASLMGVAHAWHFQRRFRDRERRALALESSLARLRLHALRDQLQPHFLFNALNSVTSMVREDPRAAEEMLISLSELLRVTLAQSHHQQTTLRSELRFTERYVEVQRFRFGDRLIVETAVAEGAWDCVIPTLLLQPLVENSIRHGLEPASDPVRIRMAARRLPGARIEIVVEDDGAGPQPRDEARDRPGVGLANVRARLAAMFGRDGVLEVFAPEGGRGFGVRLVLPAVETGAEAEADAEAEGRTMSAVTS